MSDQSLPPFASTIKRFILMVVTILAATIMLSSLATSWQQPQIQDRFELYQTNLLLRASQDIPKARSPLAKSILGENPLQIATEKYRSARQSNTRILQNLQKSNSNPQAIAQLQELIPYLDLCLGILEASQNHLETARQIWQNIDPPSRQTAQVLLRLWSSPPQAAPGDELLIQSNLISWFRDQALIQLYQAQSNTNLLDALKAQNQSKAEAALRQLVWISVIPSVGGLIGLLLVIFLVGQWLWKRPNSILGAPPPLTWNTPWTTETVWEVLVGGFFLIGQLVVPYTISHLPLDNLTTTIRGKAIVVLLSYVIMALGSLGVMYVALRAFLPLPKGWFSLRWHSPWWLWGFGGYLSAIPLVVIVSLLNQAIWQGQGGSNPILPLAAQNDDTVAFGLFLLTAALAAPVFEEIIFRGFLLPSLTKNFPAWGAISISSLIFALAHLSLSEVLPLFTLGLILGTVYLRSGSLLAPVLLHSLWNSGTMLSIYILSQGSN